MVHSTRDMAAFLAQNYFEYTMVQQAHLDNIVTIFWVKNSKYVIYYKYLSIFPTFYLQCPRSLLT